MKRGAEFSVFQGGSPPRRPPQPLPDNLNLRKQRSLNNLTLFGEGEQRVCVMELGEPAPRRPVSSLSSSPARGGSPRKEPPRDPGARGTRARSLSLTLTKMLSQSEHSLIPVPWRRTAGGRASLGAQPRAEAPARGQERRTTEEATDEESSSGRSDEEAAAAAAGRGSGGGDGGRRGGRETDGGYWAEEEAEGGAREGTAQLDKEVILTMLGDLEQVLHTQPRDRKSVV